MLDKNAAGIEVNAILTPQVPKSSVVQAAAANAATNPPATVVQLLQAGPRGGRLTKLKATPAGVIAATRAELYRENAGVKRLTNSIAVPAWASSTTTQIPPADFGYSDNAPLQLGPNEILHVAVSVANAINFEAEWADY